MLIHPVIVLTDSDTAMCLNISGADYCTNLVSDCGKEWSVWVCQSEPDSVVIKNDDGLVCNPLIVGCNVLCTTFTVLIHCVLDSLTAEDFRRILREPKDALVSQYEALLATEGVKLKFEDEAISAIAEIAYQLNQTTENIGARRLTTVMEKLMEDISFEADQRRGETVVIDDSYVRERLSGIVEDPDLSRYIL